MRTKCSLLLVIYSTHCFAVWRGGERVFYVGLWAPNGQISLGDDKKHPPRMIRVCFPLRFRSFLGLFVREVATSSRRGTPHLAFG
jgi:hypothetical protein